MISINNFQMVKNSLPLKNQNSANLYLLNKTSNGDVITFTGNNPLTRKYNINPDNVQIKADMPFDIGKQEKAVLIEKVLESYDLAQKNLKWGNISGIGYASNVALSDGSWHLASNFNNTRNDISSVCGERSAVIQAFNDKLKSMSLEKTEKYENSKKINNHDFNVKYIAMSNHKELGTDRNAGAPCTECLSWFNTNRFFNNDTKIVTLVKNNETNSYDLCLRNLVELLPYRMEINSLNTSENPISELDFDITYAANDALKEKNISETMLKKLITEAKDVYENNDLSFYSNQNIASTVMSNGEIFTGRKMDWSKRLFVEPAEYASTKALDKYGKDTHIDAIAYYGEGSNVDNAGIRHDDGTVSIQTLGRLNSKYGDSKTLVLTVQNNKIAIRTIGDYLPEKFGFVQDYIKINK